MGIYIKKNNVELPAVEIEAMEPTCLRKYNKLAKAHNHICEKCGAKMKSLPERTFLRAIEQQTLLCPQCGTAMGNLDIISSPLM